MPTPTRFIATITPEILSANVDTLATWMIGKIDSARYNSVIKSPDSDATRSHTGGRGLTPRKPNSRWSKINRDKALALIEGEKVYSKLKYESGVHRVQRVPQTEASGRIHTSAITVAILPEAEEVDVKIDPKDLRIDTFCSSGPGGQSVNTTYSAVRITHLPTNVVVSMQDEKSQIKNREKAMRVLRARLQELEEQKQHEALASERRSMVGSGDRSEKIRTYNFKENRVTDHRIGLTIHQLDLVMEGNIEEIIQALSTHYESEKLKREAVAA